MSDEELLDQYEGEFKNFLESSETVKHLPPMNSYQRRMIHHLAVEFKFDTSSEGGGDDRHVVIEKTETSAAPGVRKFGQSMVWNYGDREFIVNSMEPIWIYLAKDGSMGTWDEEVSVPIVTKKLVTSGSYKIKSNQIVEIQDDQW